jgi:hypothetical protein
MTRILAITVLTAVCAAALLSAQDEPRRDGKDKAGVRAPMPSGEKPEEIIKRLNGNFEKSEERLGAKDPREETQKVQDRIIQDLDELLKQQQDNQGGGGSGASSKSTDKGQKGNQGANRGDSSQNKNKGGQNAKNDARPKQDGDGKGKDGQGGGEGGTNKKNEPKKNTVADLLRRGHWGDHPPKKRMELEIYGKERFLPKYEDLLRQYYRTISESDRRKDE